ncbi:polyunsaturated fatty acid lipoxygenase ALOX15B-like [Ambystoma mexicanum]|uniref:polyunsaturated fatty acid lipoxygenase ALOX15B-like n=1 Tax=Ambystoma mexicanum TaxID=8296 RepID=UPI0037E9ACA8
MARYTVQVKTGSFLAAKTRDNISITLVGALGESKKRTLDNFGVDFLPGAEDEYYIKEKTDLGAIVLIRVYKERLPLSLLPPDNWYCSHFTVISPGGATYRFPCYRWIEGFGTVEIPEGTGELISAIPPNTILLKQRELELKQKQEIYRWKVYHPDFPRCLDVANSLELDSNSKYSLTKTVNFVNNISGPGLETALKGFLRRRDSWNSFDEIKRALTFHRTDVSDYVAQHWKEDKFFGYQFLNGVDPMLIKRCKKIPTNFPVTDRMVSPRLDASTTLEAELQNGNIYIADYKILDGIPANVVNGQQQYMAAPLCLLYHTPQDGMIPLAIQINQAPGPENPIFLPSDELDWILAKLWVRSSNFPFHQGLSHFLRTHAFAEVFCIATLRQLPMCHPLYKLLIPHTRYTLQINALARDVLIGPGGTIDKFTAVGVAGLAQLIARDMQSLTYASLCIPDDLRCRGIESLPNFYYRDDGLKTWSAIESYVSSIVEYYYKSEESIRRDSELQAWVGEIFKEGFLENTSSGVPSSLETHSELIKFLTMVIFTCSAQHAAVNSGQFDFLSWMPNGPSTMRKPPPKSKGTTPSLESVLDILPDVGTTANIMTTVWGLSKEPGDKRPLGTFPDIHFTEEEPKRYIRAFQSRLSEISAEIERRNESLPLEYSYLNPKVMESSVSI